MRVRPRDLGSMDRHACSGPVDLGFAGAELPPRPIELGDQYIAGSDELTALLLIAEIGDVEPYRSIAFLECLIDRRCKARVMRLPGSQSLL